MSDSDPLPKTSAPSWQQTPKSESVKEERVVRDVEAERESRETVIAQARKFLDEDEVRDASTEKKIKFLERKGLQTAEIEGLLGITRNSEASSAPESPSSPPQHSTPAQTSYSQPQQKTPQPPIITYPEFLTTSTASTPLITKPRLLTTLYLFSSITALLYGTHTYLLTPMLASLTTARLSLAETSQQNLDKLITQLEGLVSEIPPEARYKDLLADKEGEEESDEDPTEMFHRDIGIQTSPPSSRPASPSPAPSILAVQTSRLHSLRTSLADLLDDSSNEGAETKELEATVGVLREYLDGMAYVVPSYGYGVNGYNGGGYGGSGSGKEEDEIERVKKGIRGVKGVLLSARSFPGGGARVGNGVR